jgi:hypothetical protein
VTILVCLGATPETWWQAKNWVARQVLERAEQLAPDEAARTAIVEGRVLQSLDLGGMASPLQERVWSAVEEAAKQVSAEAAADPDTWPRDWAEHVAELARELEAHRA